MDNNKSTKIPGSSIHAVIDVYKKDLDPTLMRQNLKLTVEERLLNLENFVHFSEELRKAGKMLHKASSIKK